MIITTVDEVLAVIQAALRVSPEKFVVAESGRVLSETRLSRPNFPALEQLAASRKNLLVAIFPTLREDSERRIVCEVLSRLESSDLVLFWENIACNETDEELLSCAAIACARLRRANLLAKLEGRLTPATSSRFPFHLALAHLRCSSPQAIDLLIDSIERELDRPALSQHSPVAMVAHSMLSRLFPQEATHAMHDWANWWCQRRDTYQWVNNSMFAKEELEFMPPLTSFNKVDGGAP